MSEHICHVTDDTFAAEVLEASGPVLLDFWAEWCGPCKMLAPVLDEVAKEYAGKIKIAKMNIDDNQAVPASLGVRSIPTLVIFKNGNVAEVKLGNMRKPDLVAFIDSHL